MSLIEAIQRGDLEEVQRLIEQGASIHTQNDQALINAAYWGHPNIVEFLVDRGADIHARDDEALVVAVSNDHLSVVESLLQRDANIKVLSLTNQQLYQHLIPRAINVSEYYLMESTIIQVIVYSNKTILRTKNKSYFLE
jgi:ankyrin repeat protein